MIPKKLTLGLATMIFLSACTTWDLEQLQQTEASGDAFSKQLADDYRAFASFEAYEMLDWVDQRHFARKGLKAAAGEAVAPEPLVDWRVPHNKRLEMTTARTRLVTMLDAGARSAEPVLAARAQSNFDCWIEQQEEDHQPNHIAACRDAFDAALTTLEAALTPRAFTLFFEFDEDRLPAAAEPVLDAAITALSRLGPAFVEARGHADRAGPAAYNEALSRRRAEAVKAALVSRGLTAEAIATFAYGETTPRRTTPDGMREPRNRRVEIIIVTTREVGA